MKLKHKALIKDMELQIDYLIGYAPGGFHWKHEYYIRQALIDEAMTNNNVPQETKRKIDEILSTLCRMRKKDDPGSQPYLQHEETITTHTVKVNDRQNNEFYTIEI